MVILKKNSVEKMKEACEFEWLTKNDFLPSETRLRYGWFISNMRNSCADLVESAVPLIISHARALIAKKAYQVRSNVLRKRFFYSCFIRSVICFQPALRLVEDFRERFGAKLLNNYECDLERARILEACHESEAARSVLTRILDDQLLLGSDKRNINLYLDVYSMLADFEMGACRPDLAVKHLQEVDFLKLSSSYLRKSVFFLL